MAGADPLARLNYFNGQRLEATDLKTEQSYHLDVRRRLTKALFTPGIAAGLEVTKSATSAHGVTVSPGVAIDNQGREIILLEARDLLVIGAPAPLEGVAFGNFVAIEYGEDLTAPVLSGCTPQGSPAAARSAQPHRPRSPYPFPRSLAKRGERPHSPGPGRARAELRRQPHQHGRPALRGGRQAARDPPDYARGREGHRLRQPESPALSRRRRLSEFGAALPVRNKIFVAVLYGAGQAWSRPRSADRRHHPDAAPQPYRPIISDRRGRRAHARLLRR